jgi:hypothetical protein
MVRPRRFLLTTDKMPSGIEYCYDESTLTFVGISFNATLAADHTYKVINLIKPLLPLFLDWVKEIPNAVLVELEQEVTFEMVWNRYKEKIRSSKKKSLAIWSKLSTDDQIKAYYYIPTYFKNLGNFEKKLLETYLRAELWNN